MLRWFVAIACIWCSTSFFILGILAQLGAAIEPLTGYRRYCVDDRLCRFDAKRFPWFSKELKRRSLRKLAVGLLNCELVQGLWTKRSQRFFDSKRDTLYDWLAILLCFGQRVLVKRVCDRMMIRYWLFLSFFSRNSFTKSDWYSWIEPRRGDKSPLLSFATTQIFAKKKCGFSTPIWNFGIFLGFKRKFGTFGFFFFIS